jgi:hypothetical protein
MLNPGYVKNLLKMAMLIQYTCTTRADLCNDMADIASAERRKRETVELLNKAADAISQIQFHIEKFKLTKRVLISATIGESIFEVIDFGGNSCSLFSGGRGQAGRGRREADDGLTDLTDCFQRNRPGFIEGQ